MTTQVQEEACAVREQALRDATDVSKFTLVTLKAVLAYRGMDTQGSKVSVVQRICDMLRMV